MLAGRDTVVAVGLGCLLSCLVAAPLHARQLDETDASSVIERGRDELESPLAGALPGSWRHHADPRKAAGASASSSGDPQPRTSLLGCLNSPASLLVCVKAGVVSLGKVAARYEGKGKELVKLLLRWGGKVKRGGKGSHTKIQMPSGRIEIVPGHPARGTVEKIIQRALEEVK